MPAGVPSDIVVASQGVLEDDAGAAGDDDTHPPPAAHIDDVDRRRPRLDRFGWALVAIALLGFGLRAAYIIETRDDVSLCQRPVCGDARYYVAQAATVADGYGFVDPSRSQQTADHPPMTALVLAPFSRLLPDADDALLTQRLAMAAVGSLAVAGIGLLGRRVGRPAGGAAAGRSGRADAVGLIAAAIAAVDANFWMNDVLPMSEALATLGIVGTLLAVYRFVDRPTLARAAQVGLIVGLTGLVRAELLLLAPITFVPMALRVRTLRWPDRLARVAAAAAVAVAVLVPWTAYNLSRFDEPVLLSTNDGLTILGANCDQMYGLSEAGGTGFWSLGCAFVHEDRIPRDADQSVRSRIYREIGFDYARNHLNELRDVAEYRLLRGWGALAPDQMVYLNAREGRAPWASWTGFVQWWLLLVPALIGARVLRRRREPLWPLGSTAIVVTIVLAGFYGLVRFRLAADVAAVVLAAVALEVLARRRGRIGADARRLAGFGAGTGHAPVARAPAGGPAPAVEANGRDGRDGPVAEGPTGPDPPGEPGAPARDRALTASPATAASAAIPEPATMAEPAAGEDRTAPGEPPDGSLPYESLLPDPLLAEPVPASAERRADGHFPCLDAYRAIGMTMVLLNHAAYSTGFQNRDDDLARVLTPVIARFDLSVPMFFVLSGFLLFRPFARSILTDRALPDTRSFYRRRMLRILPSYWVALFGVGLLFGLHIPGVQSWIGNSLLAPAFGVPLRACQPDGSCHVAYGLTPAWSIGVEAVFYLLLPAFALLLHRLARGRPASARLGVLLGGLAVLYAVGTAFRAYVVNVDPPWAEQSLLWLPMFFDVFAVGMALAAVSAAVAAGRPLPRLAAWAGEHPLASWAVAGAIFLFMTRLPYPERPFGLRDANGFSDYLVRQFVYGIASAAWLAPALFGDQTRGRLRRVLASRPLVYLGTISLSFYLWHLPLVEKVKQWTVVDWHQREELAAHPPSDNPLAAAATFTGSYPRVVLITWVLSFLVASLLYRFVELPFLRLKDAPLRRLFRRPRR
jgi:peptidoglycan/LPS O-acetylase OafA/YrhL